ncbi:MAG: hypothetical protein FWH37_10170 [Candidatus Bathyarchaeota archaeon]|nr:hypothetical protein [Candidatus Termiticorpusculum sp.]
MGKSWKYLIKQMCPLHRVLPLSDEHIEYTIEVKSKDNLKYLCISSKTDIFNSEKIREYCASKGGGMIGAINAIAATEEKDRKVFYEFQNDIHTYYMVRV